MNFYETDFFLNHEISINKLVAKIYLGMCIVPVLVLIASIYGFYHFPINLSIITVCASLFSAIILFILSQKEKFSHSLKYFMILSIQVIILLYSCDVNVQITVIYLFSPLLALLYFNPKVSIFACVVATIFVFTGVVIEAEQAVQVIWRGVTPIQYILTNGIGHTIEMIFSSIILISASFIARRLMISLQNRNLKINSMQNDLVFSFADMIESRDGTTGEHVKRTSQIVEYITKYISSHSEKFNYNLNKNDYELIALAAPLHDIGKMKVPDAILSKPGKLTLEEYEIIKTHSVEGVKIIDKTMAKIEDPAYVRFAREMALSHHEKWNGGGYPEGLKGEEIPISARIMAVADVFDALCSKRSYKEAFSIDKAYEILEENSGIQFEPILVFAMTSIRKELEKIYVN